MQKILKNIIKIIFIIEITFILWNPIIVHATEGDNLLSNITSDVNSFSNMAESKVTNLGITTNSLSPILSLAQIFYTAGCIIVLGGTIYIAIRLGMANPTEKSVWKERLPKWIISSIIIIGAVTIWRLVIYIV